ncbi:CDP-diacylglycerol--glycerol-3-phosphate 3-phosphatidyltransferase [bacterium]|nr:CDP-diacylglycerol--glycerol-3-phosphate 3-phosphatidyltransferase [bacterium]
MVKKKKKKDGFKQKTIIKKLVNMKQDVLTLPNLLTAIRIVFVPFVLWLLYQGTPQARAITLLLYTIATLTDFFDGYLARKYKSVSYTGKMLDPLADKFIVNLTLVLMVGMGDVPNLLLPVLIILAREFYIFGVRNIAVEKGLTIPAGQSGKIKTFVQMFALPCFIVNEETFNYLFGFSFNAHNLGMILLWISIFFSVTSAYTYTLQVKRLLFKD